MKSQVILLSLAALTGCALAYPSGALSNVTNPMDALSPHCTVGNYRPKHGHFLPETSPPPYNIRVTSPSGAVYKPNQPVAITIEGVGGHKLKGFFLKVDTTAPSFAGEIVCPGSGHKVTFCGIQGITHNSPSAKGLVECTWTPPDFQVGNVQFSATILASFSSFWTGVLSDAILKPDNFTMTYEQKSIQMRDNMMREFQQKAAGLMGMFSKQAGGGNSFGSSNLGSGFASMFGSTQGAEKSTNNNNNNNMFGASSTGQGNSYPFAGFSGANKGPQSLASMFGQQGQSQGQGQGGNRGNMWSSVFGQNTNSNSNGQSGLPSQFQSFFQNA